MADSQTSSSGRIVKKTSFLREQKKKTTRDAILKTAQKLFAEKGFENTAVEDITRRIHIAQSTFFNYFPRKEDIIPEMFQKKLPSLKKKWQAILDSSEPIKNKIHEIFYTTAQLALKNENISRALLINNISSLNSQYDRAFFEEFRKALALMLEHGQRDGQIRRDVSAVRLATTLEGVFNLFVIDCLVKRLCKISSEELYERLNLCLEGFLAKPEGSALNSQGARDRNGD
jgi:AcrR family transcriptional regulator